MNLKHFVIFITIGLFFSCKEQPQALKSIQGKQLNVNESVATDKSIDDFIKPYRDHVTNDLDSVLAYNPTDLSKKDSKFNTALGNFMADAVYEQSNPIFKTRTGNDIDFVLLNFGGIRSDLAKGNITTASAYELMPFENEVVVAEMDYNHLQQMARYLITRQTAHPLSKQVELLGSQNGKTLKFTINGKPLDKSKTYFVATNNYLYNGGDKMDFFQNSISVTNLDYLIRKELIDYFYKIDTLQTQKDNRFLIQE